MPLPAVRREAGVLKTLASRSASAIRYDGCYKFPPLNSVSLAAGENRLRHLKFPEFSASGTSLSARYFLRVRHRHETVAKGQQGIERNQALIIQNRTNSSGQLPGGFAGPRALV